MSATQMIVSGVAGRYASALFDLARDGDLLDQVAGELRTIEAMVRDSADLKHLIVSPLYRREEQTEAILAVADSAGLTDLTRRFLGVVAENSRLSELHDMIAAFAVLLADLRGEVTAQVTSAIALSDDQLAAIKKKLSAFAGREVTVDTEVDEGLIGGMVVRLGSRMIDSSLKTKVENLQLAMKEGD
ncbi:MAG: F0F1 ATP synthase subunit delta [Sphingomonadales bacterium]